MSCCVDPIKSPLEMEAFMSKLAELDIFLDENLATRKLFLILSKIRDPSAELLSVRVDLLLQNHITKSLALNLVKCRHELDLVSGEIRFWTKRHWQESKYIEEMYNKKVN